MVSFARAALAPLAAVACLLANPLAAQTPAAPPRPAPATPATNAPTVAARLGYPANAKLLILHADDLGVAHSVNAASLDALERGVISSASVMMPTPWVPEVAAWARAHPGHDLGLHLTLTSEWRDYRWGTVAPASQVPTLLDSAGQLPPDTRTVAERAAVGEVERELRAQVERALAVGLRPTHLDSHMGALFTTPALYGALQRVARSYGLPFLATRSPGVRLPEGVRPDVDVLLDTVVTVGPDTPPERWAQWYLDAVRNLKPGLTEMIVHLGRDDAELQAVTVAHPDWGSAWRRRDDEVLRSAEFRQALRDHGVTLVRWRDLQRLAAQPGGARLVAAVDGLRAPEAVRYDPQADVYYVSNWNDGPASALDNNGFISRVRADGTVDRLRWIAGGANGVTLHAPRGLAITGDTLWAVDADAVRGFDRRTGAVLATVSFAGNDLGFLNDVAPGPDGALYVTDTGRNRIYRVANGRATVAVTDSALGSPNGITWDPAGRRLLVVPFGGGHAIRAWRPSAPAAFDTVGTSPGAQFDGVEVLAGGRVLVASQADSSLHLFAAAGAGTAGGGGRLTGTPAVRLAGRPADIAVDTRRRRVAVPFVARNRVEIWELPRE